MQRSNILGSASLYAVRIGGILEAESVERGINEEWGQAYNTRLYS